VRIIGHDGSRGVAWTSADHKLEQSLCVIFPVDFNLVFDFDLRPRRVSSGLRWLSLPERRPSHVLFLHIPRPSLKTQEEVVYGGYLAYLRPNISAMRRLCLARGAKVKPMAYTEAVLDFSLLVQQNYNQRDHSNIERTRSIS
jgi:hypothetical protein